jgi:hypothetical protein
MHSHYMRWRRLGGEEVYLLLILDPGNRWGEWLASCLGCALPPEKGPWYPLVMRLWMGLRACLDTDSTGEILCLCRGSNPDRPVVYSLVKTLY